MSEPLDPIDEIYTNPAPIVDFIKLEIGFWEKIVVLDSAILGLSFTSVAFLRIHAAGDGGVGYLVAAWKLLFFAIGSFMVAQWIAIPGAIGIFGYVSGIRVLSLLQARSPLKEVDLALPPKFFAKFPTSRRELAFRVLRAV